MLLFFARDGYFMAGLYELLAKRLSCGQAPNGIYFMISRRLAAIAAIENEEDLLEVVRLPYNGTFAQYMPVSYTHLYMSIWSAMSKTGMRSKPWCATMVIWASLRA